MIRKDHFVNSHKMHFYQKLSFSHFFKRTFFYRISPNRFRRIKIISQKDAPSSRIDPLRMTRKIVSDEKLVLYKQSHLCVLFSRFFYSEFRPERNTIFWSVLYKEKCYNYEHCSVTRSYIAKSIFNNNNMNFF